MQISVEDLTGEPVVPAFTVARGAECPGRDAGEFIRRARLAKFLSREDEVRLATLWSRDGNIEARNALVASHMHMAISMARKASHNPEIMNDMVQQATLGLMKAADRFDPSQGFRFSTYAQWWVLASMQDFSVKMHSIVQIKPSNVQRRLFNALRWAYNVAEKELRAAGEHPAGWRIRQIASERLGIPCDVIEEFEGRIIHNDASLNMISASGEEDGTEWIDRVACDRPNAEDDLCDRQSRQRMTEILQAALAELSERERAIIMRRKLADKEDGETLASVAAEYRISRERVRQIELRALEKMQRFICRTFGRNAVLKEIFA